MHDMSISSFDDLLRAARQQPEPQRMLFVFTGAELPDDSTPEQRRDFAAGAGGALVPLMCVDKTPDELTTFAALAEESRATGLARRCKAMRRASVRSIRRASRTGQ